MPRRSPQPPRPDRPGHAPKTIPLATRVPVHSCGRHDPTCARDPGLVAVVCSVPRKGLRLRNEGTLKARDDQFSLYRRASAYSGVALLANVARLLENPPIRAVLVDHPLGKRFAVLGRRELRLIEEVRVGVHCMSFANTMHIMAGDLGSRQASVDVGNQFFLSVWIKQVRLLVFAGRSGKPTSSGVPADRGNPLCLPDTSPLASRCDRGGGTTGREPAPTADRGDHGVPAPAAAFSKY